MLQGMLALLFIDTGHLVQMANDGESFAAVLSTDLWQAVKKMVPGKVWWSLIRDVMGILTHTQVTHQDVMGIVDTHTHGGGGHTPSRQGG